MPSLPTLYPVGTISAGSWTDEAGGTTDLHLVIDETGTGGTDYIRTPVDSTFCLATFNITDMPSDFGSMISLSAEIRHSRGGVEGGDSGGGDDTWNLWLRLVQSDGSTPLTDALQVEASTSGYLVKTETLNFTGVSSSDKTTWNNAQLWLWTDATISGAGDGDRTWVDFVRLTGTYDVGVVASLNLLHVGV